MWWQIKWPSGKFTWKVVPVVSCYFYISLDYTTTSPYLGGRIRDQDRTVSVFVYIHEYEMTGQSFVLLAKLPHDNNEFLRRSNVSDV